MLRHTAVAAKEAGLVAAVADDLLRLKTAPNCGLDKTKYDRLVHMLTFNCDLPDGGILALLPRMSACIQASARRRRST